MREVMQSDTGATGSISGHRSTIYGFEKYIYSGHGTFDNHFYFLGFIRCYRYIPNHSCHGHTSRRNYLPVIVQYISNIIDHIL